MELDQQEQVEASCPAILGVLACKPSDQVLSVLAAGPLEYLIHYWGTAFIDRIEDAARRYAMFRSLLEGVWQRSTPEVWSRVTAFGGEIGADDVRNGSSPTGHPMIVDSGTRSFSLPL